MKKLFKAFSHAIDGLFIVLRTERNFKIHTVAFIFTCALGFYLSVSKMEWLVILLISALVMSLEILNSSIEKVCDKIELNQDSKIKIIKDTAAAAVFMAAAFAFIIGLMIFIPYFLTQE